MTGAFLVDSSVWVDLLRGRTPSLADRLASLTDSTATIVTCEPVALELLGGATERTLPRVQRLVDGLAVLDVDPHADFRTAAALSRACRAQGRTVRSLMDCLIAAVALRHGVVVVHRDRDFDNLAAVSALRTERWE